MFHSKPLCQGWVRERIGGLAPYLSCVRYVPKEKVGRGGLRLPALSIDGSIMPPRKECWTTLQEGEDGDAMGRGMGGVKDSAARRG